MIVKDNIILKMFEIFLLEELSSILVIDFNKNELTFNEKRVEESEILFENVGNALKRYANAFLNGTGINGNEEINSDNDLASNLLMKIFTEDRSKN